MEAYSDDTSTRYSSWDALVEAEANGYAVVTTTDRRGTAPAVAGPFPTKAEAQRARVRLRRLATKQEPPGHKVRSYVRVLWKDR